MPSQIVSFSQLVPAGRYVITQRVSRQSSSVQGLSSAQSAAEMHSSLGRRLGAAFFSCFLLQLSQAPTANAPASIANINARRTRPPSATFLAPRVRKFGPRQGF